MKNRFLKLDDTLYRYVVDHSLRELPVQADLRAATHQLPRSGMQIPFEQGQLMALLAKLVGARRAIEVGVFTGYSALCVALALPEDGRLLACEVDEAPTHVAREFWARAGVADRVDLRIAPALQTLQRCLRDGEGESYDFAFIDADKASYEAYYELCLQLLRPGGLVMLDNTLWGGEVAHPSTNADTLHLQQLNRKIHRDSRVDMVLLPLSDGLTLARKR